jgi:hypothetical protein
MWCRLALIGVFVGGIGGGAANSTAAEKSGAIEPKADAALHRMSDYLAGLKTFSVDTSTVDETQVEKDGQKIQTLAHSKISVRRPGEMRIDRVSPKGRVVFRDDGKQFSVYDSDQNIYATAPAPDKLDQAADAARVQLEIEAPGIDLIASNPYDALTEGVTEGRYIGLEPMGDGVMAHHLAVTKKNVTYQIWIQDGPQPVPLRYVVAGRGMRGSPQFTIQMRNWQPSASVPDDSFAFTPPAGATKVAFAPRHKG